MYVSELLRNIKSNQDALEWAKSLYRDRLAPDFNSFDFIEPDEMRLSSILAWLLSSRATHGQGGRFLHVFIKCVFRSCSELAWLPEACEKAEAHIEFTVNGGRLDILIRSADRTLVIENKAGAGDQPDQIKRYAVYLDSLNQADTRLIYLTPDGSEPSTESIAEQEKVRRIEAGQLHCWSYQEHILEWLAECRAVCRADRVSIFIDEFAQYIRKRFIGIADMTVQGQLVQDVTRSLDTLAPAMQVILAADAIRAKLLSTLCSQIQTAIMHREGWSLVDWNMSSKKWSGFSIRFSDNGQFIFCVEFGSSDYNSFTYGVGMKNKEEGCCSYDTNVPEAIKAQVGPGKQSRCWPWYRIASPQEPIFKVEPNWKTAVEPWVTIADGTLAETTIRTAIHFRDVLARCGFL